MGQKKRFSENKMLVHGLGKEAIACHLSLCNLTDIAPDRASHIYQVQQNTVQDCEWAF